MEWEEVEDMWQTPGMGAGIAATVVLMWVSTLSWAKGNAAGFSLNGSPPANIFIDNTFDQCYLAAPLISHSQ